jgi:penicillin-insensitive murein endopeptidase
VRALALGLLAFLAGCVEWGVVSDGSSISVGKPNRGYLIDGVRLPDHGDGYTTREVWLQRANRYGTDELIDLVTGVARRMSAQVKDVKLVVADLSGRGGGANGSSAFHRSHQSGRDADLLYYMRDAAGKPFEPDGMHAFNWRGVATDRTGITIDVPRTWLLVKELIEAPEAPVQFIFIYEPIAQLLIDEAKRRGEPEAVIARARRTLRQPGDSARHDDHMHVRVYCAREDRAYGCVDIGPMDLLAEREAETSRLLAKIGAAVASDGEQATAQAAEPGSALPAALGTTTLAAPATSASLLSVIGGTDRFDLRSWP